MDYSTLYSQCALCPNNCSVNRNAGQTGRCAQTSEIRVAWSGLHRGEEPPVTGEKGSGMIFFCGCPLHCQYCQNYQISQQNMGRDLSREEFAEICLRLQDAGAENINLVTPSHHIPVLARFLTEARKRGLTLPICWNSSGYDSPHMLELLDGLVTIWLPDFK
ncbi:MAG: 4Fe-4S cluster-binding domain-containing protein, partial [Spirochaetales bacterium]|nr:4Fe-4S cluster-binding domain-containing protein [Spirochaetales bacterium]